jgi:hypothetical protein
MLALSPVSVHMLNHPTLCRWYTFRVLEDEVEVVRRVGSRTEWRVRMSKENARKRWAWLVKLGYVQW